MTLLTLSVRLGSMGRSSSTGWLGGCNHIKEVVCFFLCLSVAFC